MKKQFDLTSVN